MRDVFEIHGNRVFQLFRGIVHVPGNFWSLLGVWRNFRLIWWSSGEQLEHSNRVFQLFRGFFPVPLNFRGLVESKSTLPGGGTNEKVLWNNWNTQNLE